MCRAGWVRGPCKTHVAPGAAGSGLRAIVPDRGAVSNIMSCSTDTSPAATAIEVVLSAHILGAALGDADEADTMRAEAIVGL